MAFNDMSAFMPSKSQYTNPGEYETTQRNLALSRGTYMAEMDTTYAQLDEMSRQFDLSYKLQERETAVSERGAAVAERQAGVAERGVAVSEGQLELGQGQLELGWDESKREWEELILNMDQQTFEQEYSTAAFLESIRQFDVNALLQQQGLSIQAESAAANTDYLESLSDYNQQGTIMDWIGAADTIFSWMD